MAEKPKKIQQLLAHAADCMAKYDLESAYKFYEKAVTLSPDDTDLLDAAGEICVELGKTDDAVRLLKRSLELRPDENAFKYMNLGQLMSGEDSLQLFQKGTEMMHRDLDQLAPEDEEAREKLSARLCSGYCSMTELFMTDLCDREDAERLCEEFLQRAQTFQPNSPELHIQWANLRLCQSRQEDAKKLTFKALNICNRLEEGDKPTLEMRTSLMKLLIELGQVDEAEEFGRSLLEVDDEYVETWYLLGLIHLNQGSLARARECAAAATRILEREGVTDEEQAARVQELTDELEKRDPGGAAGAMDDEDDDDGEEPDEGAAEEGGDAAMDD